MPSPHAALFADIGLGRRLAAVVARLRLAAEHRTSGKATGAGSAPPPTRRSWCGTEGMAVQMANCCHPIPGRCDRRPHPQGPRSGRAPCRLRPRAAACKADPDRWIELTWARDPATHFHSRTRRQRGKRARRARSHRSAAIAEAESNVLNVHVDDEDARIALILFKVQVRDAHPSRACRAGRTGRLLARPRGGLPRAHPCHDAA